MKKDYKLKYPAAKLGFAQARMDTEHFDVLIDPLALNTFSARVKELKPTG